MTTNNTGSSSPTRALKPTQVFVLVLLGIVLCASAGAFLGFAWNLAKPLPTTFPTLTQPSWTKTLTETASPSQTASESPTPTASETPEATQTPESLFPLPPDTSEGIHVALIFNGDVSDPWEEYGLVDVVWGSQYPDEPAGIYNLFYYPFDRGVDGESGGMNHDLAYFKANHPDWIVYRCDRITPSFKFGGNNVPLDITNPEVLEYMLETDLAPAIEAGYQGIAFDNVDFFNHGSRCGTWHQGQWVELADNMTAVLNWAEWMVPRLHDLGASVAMNFPYNFDHPAESDRLLQLMDIAVDERGFTNWGKGREEYIAGEQWLTLINTLQSLDSMGKGFISINEMPEDFDEVSREEKQWVLANYLLVKSRFSYVSISGIQEYGHLFIAPEYAAPIGCALDAMYPTQGVWMRDFSNGLVMVNPSTSETFTVTLPGGTSYQDLYGEPESVVTLGPLSGIVLLEKDAHAGNPEMPVAFMRLPAAFSSLPGSIAP